MMNQRENKTLETDVKESRRRYIKPEIKRIDLALEETLSAGCKMVEGCGSDPFDPEGGQAGS